jgi:hypothetical protein
MKLFLQQHLAAPLLLLLASLLPAATYAEDCAQPGEQEAIFTLFLDEDSDKENGWKMQCDDVVVWNVPTGSVLETAGFRTKMHRSFIRDTACIPVTSTCTFTIEDARGDGLQYPGYYTLTYGATTISVYNRKPFHENSVCFGPKCTVLADEVAQDYDDLYFYLKLDANPEETEYSIVCGVNTILEGKGYVSADAYLVIEEEAKVEPFACCTLTISDAGNDGLKEQEEEFNGNAVYLDWATHEVISYGSDVEFGTLSIDFGLGC